MTLTICTAHQPLPLAPFKRSVVVPVMCQVLHIAPSWFSQRHINAHTVNQILWEVCWFFFYQESAWLLYCDDSSVMIDCIECFQTHVFEHSVCPQSFFFRLFLETHLPSFRCCYLFDATACIVFKAQWRFWLQHLEAWPYGEPITWVKWLNAIDLHRKPISKLRSVTRRMGSHSEHRWTRPALTPTR